jgi:nucleotide-binding universal stress UspA family protein
MRVLIAYDGSACADDMLLDLTRAGLPPDTEALVVTISEVWLPGVPEEEPEETSDRPIEVRNLRARAAHELHEAHEVAVQGAERVQGMFPMWTVNARAHADAAAWGVLEVASEWKPDLIVVGSQGRSAIKRVLLGSVSLKILSEATCSVRIARCNHPVNDAPLRIVIGIDGSPDARAAVEEVAQRHWPAQSAVQVVALLEPMRPAMVPPLGSHFPVMGKETRRQTKERFEKALDDAVVSLREAGLNASAEIGEGQPDKVLLEIASQWGADAIFVGARGHRFMERILLGSVSSALATHAHCSVEVVRHDGEQHNP